MPLEQLQKLFEQVGEAAQRLSQLRAGQISLGGRVAISETVQSVADLRRQLGEGRKEDGQRPLPIDDLRTLIAELKRLNERLKPEESKTEKTERKSEGRDKKDQSSLLKRIPPVSWVEAGLALADYVEKQQRAGKAVDAFTYSLAVASRFLYSFATGHVVTSSGQRIPWRRALARALRRYPALRPVRRLLTAPDIYLRRTARHIKIASGGRTLPSLREAAQKVAQTRKAPKLGITPPGHAAEKLAEAQQVAEPRPAGITQPAAAAQTAAARGMGARAAAGAAEAAGAGATRAGIAAAGAAEAAGAGGAAGAGAGGAGAAAGAGAGAAAAGGGLLAAAGPVGIAAAAILALVAAVIAAVVAMRKFTVSVAQSAQSLLAQRYAKYGQYAPGIAYAEARMEAYDIQSRISQGAATAGTTLALTEATIQLRREMGQANKTFLNLQLLGTLLLVHVARGVNLLLKLTAIVPLLDWLVKKLTPKTPDIEFPVEHFLRGLEQPGQAPRVQPPRQGLPPWQ